MAMKSATKPNPNSGEPTDNPAQAANNAPARPIIPMPIMSRNALWCPIGRETSFMSDTH